MRRVTMYPLLISLLMVPGLAQAIMQDDPMLVMLKLDQLELRDAEVGDLATWEGHLWIGKDLNKFWIKSEGESSDPGSTSSEWQYLYSRAVDSNWDLQVGLRQDVNPGPQRDWYVIGFSGLAPYWFEIDTALFVERDGQVNLRFASEYEIMLTQKWVLSPEIEVNWYNEADPALEIGKGLADLELGLRLRYEVTRDFAPYIGVNHEQLLGDSKDLANAAGAETSETQLVLGVSFWF